MSQPSALKSPAMGMSPGLPKKNLISAVPWCSSCAGTRIRRIGGTARGVDAVAVPVAHDRVVAGVAEEERRGEIPLPLAGATHRSPDHDADSLGFEGIRVGPVGRVSGKPRTAAINRATVVRAPDLTTSPPRDGSSIPPGEPLRQEPFT